MAFGASIAFRIPGPVGAARRNLDDGDVPTGEDRVEGGGRLWQRHLGYGGGIPGEISLA
ncbi:hypothetical protein [Streptomyces poonensis]|uniref:hypothetical protein n=1 Tax=Streptomyces poonensis TaxID=68255 RepID=UPI001674FC3F|nr:hypothetical protein [Streptomyces poonensis]